MSAHETESQVFSLRQVRVVRYRISVHTQWSDSGRVVFSDSGVLVQTFMLNADSNTSEVNWMPRTPDQNTQKHVVWWCNSRVSDLRSRGCAHDSRSGRYRVVTDLHTWMQTSRSKSYSAYNQHQSQLSFHPCGVGKSSSGCRLLGVKAGCLHLYQVAGNTVWSHMAGDAMRWVC